MRFIKKILKKFLNFFRAIAKIPRAIKNAKGESYFPEKERKKYGKRVRDNLSWLFKYKEVNPFYTLYGLDVKDSVPQSEYMDNLGFMSERNMCNHLKAPESQTSLLRDKLMFYKYLSFAGFNTPEVFAVSLHGKLYDLRMNEVEPEKYLADEKDYFVKDFIGECASFVKHIKDFDEFKTVQLDNKAGYIFQRKISLCAKMSELNPRAINTIRVVTVNKDGAPYLFSSVLRVGTAKCGDVDNWAAGGLSVGVDESGRLREYGFYKKASAGKANVHPDTNVVFSEFCIPEYKKCIDTALELHKHFYNVRFIGWDIAVTDDGPCFIEGNDNWELSMMQAPNEPMRQAWKEAVK